MQLRAGDTERLTRRQNIERELSLIEAYEKNLVDAIAKGQQMDPLLAKLKAEESGRRTWSLSWTGSAPTDVVNIDEARLKRELRAGFRTLRAFWTVNGPRPDRSFGSA